jgi:hypothetical protein
VQDSDAKWKRIFLNALSSRDFDGFGRLTLNACRVDAVDLKYNAPRGPPGWSRRSWLYTAGILHSVGGTNLDSAFGQFWTAAGEVLPVGSLSPSRRKKF